jgi:hypothetical protein
VTISIDKLNAVRERLRRCDSFTRLPALLAAHEDLRLSDEEFLTILGEEWSGFDNISQHPEVQATLKRILSNTPEMLQYMMTPAEAAVRQNLPKHFTAYRGCYSVNMDGISYSQDLQTAMAFPGLNRYRIRPGKPLLIAATIERDACIIKSDRNEREIIALALRIKSVRQLSKRELAAAVAAHSAATRNFNERMMATIRLGE